MKYLMLGAGGTGGILGSALLRAGKDVSFLAHGRRAEVMRKTGLTVTSDEETFHVDTPKVFTIEDALPKVDVIFLCVKGYSLEEVLPAIEKASEEHTVTLPILNAFGLGDKLAEQLPDLTFLDSCLFVNALSPAYGQILRQGPTFRITMGCREAQPISQARLEEIRSELIEAGIETEISEQIRRDTFRKFSFTSVFATAGAYFHVTAEAFQHEGPERDTLLALSGEIDALAKAMGLGFEESIVDIHRGMVASLSPVATSSFYRDYYAGNRHEADSLIFEILRLADQYGVDVPTYRRLSVKFL